MNLHSVAIWHPRDPDGVVVRVRLLAKNHREPIVCQPEDKTKKSSPPDLLDESNEEDEEFSFDEGFSHANPLAMAKRYKVVRSEELSIFVQEPFPGVESSYQFKLSPLWFELFGLIPKFWITEELLDVGHGNATLGHNMPCWQCGLRKGEWGETKFKTKLCCLPSL